MTGILVFVGPSLAVDERQLAGARFLPPAGQGDIIRHLDEGPEAIALIDGYFGNRLSVHQKEILEAIERGIPVYGAASMGALRAAELSCFGMIGVGGIFRDYLYGALESDADVAVTHAPEALGFAATTIAAVDLRATLASASGSLSRAEFEHLRTVAERLHFSDRTPAAIAHAAGPMRLDVAALFRDRFVSRKRTDALQLLDVLASGIPTGQAQPDLVPRTREYRRMRKLALGQAAESPL